MQTKNQHFKLSELSFRIVVVVDLIDPGVQLAPTVSNCTICKFKFTIRRSK